jgi:hypothetical protein
VDAPRPDEAVSRLADAVQKEQAWLERHDIHLDHAPDEVEIDVVERIEIDTDVGSGVWRGLFRYELRPTTADDVENVTKRTRLARGDLLELLSNVDEATRQSLDERLRQFCVDELELISRLGSHSSVDLPEGTLDRLRVTREHSENRFRNLLPGDKERMAVFGGEKWTTRKVLRCFAVAERELLRGVGTALGGLRTRQSPR